MKELSRWVVVTGVLSSFILSAFASTSTPLPNPYQSLESVTQEVNFLTGSLLQKGSGTFQTVKAELPLSYFSNNMSYWGEYVCQTKDCNVTDTLDYPPYSITPTPPDSVGGQLQEEREFSSQGADIYDAATWQIAVALAAANHIDGISEAAAQVYVDNQIARLNKIPSRATACDKYDPTKGYCDNYGFSYGYGDTATNIQNLQFAYGFRMLGPSFLNYDPLYKTDYRDYIKDDGSVPDENEGQITWADFKPITGENSWAFLIGPLQAMDLLNSEKELTVNNPAYANALDFLWSLQRMQSPIGAFYYATRGSLGNTGEAIPTGEISVENNLSILGGLHILQNIIQQTPDYQSNSQLASANNVINIMLYGGKLPQGGETKGLLYFFHYDAWNTDEQTLYQGGTYDKGVFTPTTTPFALDVDTWGVAALGPKTIDQWWGPGTAYRIWENARRLAGYFGPYEELWGVGYTDQTHSENKVMSGEWSAGAINAVHILINYYTHNPGISALQLAKLNADQDSMLVHLLDLRNDKYQATLFQNGVAAGYLSSLPKDEKAFFYASSRYYIPFGWYANPLPSTASTSWAVMLSYWFNPFNYQGSIQSQDFSLPPPAYDPNDPQLVPSPGVTILNELSNPDTHQYELPVTVSYATTSTPPVDWHTLVIINNGSWQRVVIPSDAEMLSVAYQDKDNWYSACELVLTQKVKETLAGNPLHTAIIAKWEYPHGKGSCEILSDDSSSKGVKS